MSTVDLYGELLKKHAKNPSNYGENKNVNHIEEGANPLCGDKITLYLSFNAEEQLEHISFTGKGCAICMASASMMTEVIKHQTKGSIHDYIIQFEQLLNTESIDRSYSRLILNNENILKDLGIFQQLADYPARKKCALLPWLTLKKAISVYQSN